AGGTDAGGNPVAAGELYDPATATFATLGNLVTPRSQHTATLLPTGKVLLAGGTGTSSVLASAELFDPATKAFTATGSLAAPRRYHTAVLLPTGAVLFAGGYDGTTTLSSGELYQ
ncbi:MAG TPA: kelch repeat-containing protein, partial [Holophagaceae bacterium]